MKKTVVTMLLMVMVCMALPTKTSAQFPKKKSTSEADTAVAQKQKSGFDIAKGAITKETPVELAEKIRKQNDSIVATSQRLKAEYGKDMDNYEEQIDKLKALEMNLGKESDSYKTTEKDLEVLIKSNKSFEKEIKAYKDELKKLDGMVEQLTKTMKAEMKENYVEKYDKYVENRPVESKVELDPVFWGLVVQDQEKLKNLQNLVSLNSIVYETSKIYTDLYFKNDEEKAYTERVQGAWAVELAEIMKSDDNQHSIAIKRQAFINNAISSQEFQAIARKKADARKAIKDQLKETSFNALSLALNELLDANGINSVKRPENINQKDFLTLVKDESNKGKDVLNMLLKTSQGTSLVTRQAVKSGILELQIAGKEASQKAFVMTFGDIEIIVIEDGKIQTSKIGTKYLDEKDQSYDDNLTKKDESERKVALACMLDVTRDLNAEINGTDITSVMESPANETLEK